MLRLTVLLVMSTWGCCRWWFQVWVRAWVVVGGSGRGPSPLLAEDAADVPDGEGGVGDGVVDAVRDGVAVVAPGDAEGEGAVGGDAGWMAMSLVLLSVRVVSVMLRVMPMLKVAYVMPWLMVSLVILMVRVLQVMVRLVVPLVMMWVCVLLGLGPHNSWLGAWWAVLLADWPASLAGASGDADGEGAAGEATGVAVSGDAYVRVLLVMVSLMPMALYCPGGADGESAEVAHRVFVSLVMPTVRVPQGMQWWMVSAAMP